MASHWDDRPVHHSTNFHCTNSLFSLSLFFGLFLLLKKNHPSLKELPSHLSHKLPTGKAPAIQLSMLRVSKRRTWRTAGRISGTTSELSKPSSCCSVSKEASHIRSHLTIIPVRFFRILILSQMCQGDVWYYKYTFLNFYPDAPWFVTVLNSHCAHLLSA